jgi:uncharacterized Tic20 family protein
MGPAGPAMRLDSAAKSVLNMALSSAAYFICIFTLMALACYAVDHDTLAMLYMYSTPIVLAPAFGIVHPFDFANLSFRDLRMRKRD